MNSDDAPVLHFVLADTCPACHRVKRELQHIEARLKELKLPYQVYLLPSTSSNPSDHKVPAEIARVLKWFPFIALTRGGKVIAVFNAEPDGTSGYKHTSSEAKFPNADNIVAFYQANKSRTGSAVPTLQAPPPTTPGVSPSASSGNRVTGFIPTAACRTGFKGRLV